jgi:hypothetical protein
MDRETESFSRRLIALAIAELIPLGGITLAQRLPQVVDIIISASMDSQKGPTDEQSALLPFHSFPYSPFLL